MTMQALLVLWCVVVSHGVQGWHDYSTESPTQPPTEPPTEPPREPPTEPRTEPPTARPSCQYNCGYNLGNCSCSSSCRYYGNCCYDYNTHCITTAGPETTAPQPSCRYNCGYNLGSCSCSSSCQYYGNCCYDYNTHCQATTARPRPPTTRPPITARPSCRNNCGNNNLGSCSCSSSCRYYGNCCYDYNTHCITTAGPETTAPATARPSCRYNCGNNLGSCSCSSSCRYYGNCCYDYNTHCQATTARPRPTTPDRPSCRYNCGYNLGSCSCSSSCRNYGNCCYDYNTHCQATTARPRPTTPDRPSCRYNCGYNLGSCSCSSSCQYYGNCCYDYNTQCQATTGQPATSAPYCGGSLYGNGNFSSPNYPSQYYNNANCIWKLTANYRETVSLSFTDIDLENCCNCDSISIYDGPSVNSPYLGRVCHPQNPQNSSFQSSSRYMTVVFRTDSSVVDRGFNAEFTSIYRPSCRYNCGNNMGNCSCSRSCRYYGNCCYDYNTHCQATTARPRPPTTEVSPSARPSCRYNCGNNMGNCSCSSSCRYYGNCCYDYYTHCGNATAQPPTSAPYCGGSLYGNGTFSSPNYPSQYYNNANCTWKLTADYRETVSLSFTDLDLEICSNCNCDSIDIYDGPSVNSPYLGRVCHTQNESIESSSRYMTVVFRTDSSVVDRGFNAEFTSVSQPISKGRVDCSSGNMNIVVERSYLNSVGYDGYSLYLNDQVGQYCRPRYTNTQVVFDFPLNACGTELKVENGAKMVYTNAVRAYTSSYGEITRQSYFRLNAACGMEPDMMVQTVYRVHEPVNGNFTGTGRFNGSMAFYRSFNSSDQVTEFPYKVALNQNVYVQVNLTSGSDIGLVIFPYTCVASPSPHDFQSRAYDLVRNGCARDNSYHDFTAGSYSFARFSFKSFKFLRAHEMVYLQCRVLICPASDQSSRCRRGCRSRMARDLTSDHDSHTMVLGPFQLKDTEEQDESTSKEEIKA